MVQFTVVISDVEGYDSGFRGSRAYWWLSSRVGAYAQLSLYWFLVAYCGRANVHLMRPSELLGRSSKVRTNILFVGIPTHLSALHLAGIQFDRMVLYDSSDSHELNFDYSDTSFLKAQTNTCLKNWRDDRWTSNMKIGLLPIKRPPLNNRLHRAILRRDHSIKHHVAPERCFDVGFVARPTGSVSTNQRLRWLVEIKQQRPDLKLWGGLVGGRYMKDLAQKQVDPDILKSLWLNKKKIGFTSYFDGLCQSKVALAPSGYAPWSYRHFEALYAGCVVVSNELCHYEFLIPFPRELMVEVADDVSVVSAIDQALAIANACPDTTSKNRDYLDRWLDRGKYSRACKDTLDRFMSDLAQ
jgi:hypothetical protein